MQMSCESTKCSPVIGWNAPIVSVSLSYSYYDHPLPSVISADTLHDLVTLTFDLLTLVSGHTWRVTWSIPLRSLKILRLSILELWVLTSPVGYHWQCVCSHRACAAISRDLCVRGQIFPTYLKSLTLICLFSIQLLQRYDWDRWSYPPKQCRALC